MLNEFVITISLTLAVTGTNIPLAPEVHTYVDDFATKALCEEALETPAFSNALRTILRQPTPSYYLLDVDSRCVTK